MSKPKRGKNARKISDWRGTCPICERKRVRVLWTALKENEAIRVCKRCGD